MGSLNSVTVGQEQDGDFWTNNPIISNRRTVRYYGIKQTQDNTTHEEGKVPISYRTKQKTSRDLKLPLP